jgi:NADP-reducing hydrogenase subunit HndD
MVNLKINDISVTIDKNTTILDAAKSIGISIPTLCYLRDVNEIGACRVCVVEDKTTNKIMVSCTSLVKDGMDIHTDTTNIINSRKNTLELIASEHNKNCDECVRNNNCELQNLLIEYKVSGNKFKGSKNEYECDESTSYLVRDNSKCILCNRCVSICDKCQSIAVIGKNERGNDTHIGCAFDKNLFDSPCVACGQCINVCPTGALTEKDDIFHVRDAINNPEIYTIVAIAPAVRFTIGEGFDTPIGTNVKGKLVTALKHLGFNEVFDINYGADLTIMEEGNEFVDRLLNKGTLPLITSCSPAWVDYLEKYYPEMIENLSTCKSPQKMFGAIIKTYYAKIKNIDPSKIFVTTIMPCVSKKKEILKNDNATEYSDVDAVLTARELIRFIKQEDIDFNSLENSEFDNPFGNGASVVFGASGGVMEAALRSIKEVMEGKPLEKIEFNSIRGMEGIKEAVIEIKDKKIKIAVASGLTNARILLDKIKNKEIEYHFIEIMACPGGCINGGGQPIINSNIRNYIDFKTQRSKSLYAEDEHLLNRKAHKNKDIIKLYENFLGKPGSEIAHKILHTSYQKQEKYK